MLLLHRTFIRLALAFLILGVGAGAVLELGRSWGDGGWLVPVTLHVHLLAVGFLLNMVMGVAHWMFPRLPGTTARDAARDPLGWANLLALNGGLLLRIPGEMLPSPNVRVLAAVLQALGVAFFVAAIWKRVRFPKVAASRSRTTRSPRRAYAGARVGPPGLRVAPGGPGHYRRFSLDPRLQMIGTSKEGGRSWPQQRRRPQCSRASPGTFRGTTTAWTPS